MSATTDIDFGRLAVGYGLLVFPLALMLWLRVAMIRDTLIAVLRMTVQLLFVGFYLQVVFRLNSVWLNAAWLLIMIAVADGSVIRGCGLRPRRFIMPLFAALLIGAAAPLAVLLGPVLRRPGLLDAQYAIPLGGMILGNCLRADIIGVKFFYQSVRDGERAFLLSLSQGAALHEALRPYLRDACRSALAPTVATIATIGLVALPGMMTGTILGGASPMVAIKYQILIMLAIFAGTSITLAAALFLTRRSAFSDFGMLDKSIFAR